MRRGLAGELERVRRWRRCGAMLRSQDELLLAAAQEQVAVAPGMQIAGAAQGLAVDRAALLAQMMDKHERELIAALQEPELGQEPGHLVGRVLVNAVQPHQGIEDQEARAMVGEGGGEAGPVAVEIEPQTGTEDQAEFEPDESEAASRGNRLDAE